MKKLLNDGLHAIALFALFLLAPASVCADVVKPDGSGLWVDNWTPTNGGVYFWDNKSWDGKYCNVGFVLTGQAGSTGNACNNVVPSGIGILLLNPPPGNIPFWAQADGKSAVTDFWFSPTSSQHDVQLEVEIAGYANKNQLGVYFKDGTSKLLFNGLDSAPKTASFTANGGFGFYVVANGKPNTTYYTESGWNPTGEKTSQHFALFRESPTGKVGRNVDDYWLGVEDLPVRPGVNNDRDYQDMLFRVHTATVPEPTSLFQLCTYLLCFAMVFGVTRLRKSRG